MAFEFIASAAKWWGIDASSSLQINKPTGTTDGDIMFAVLVAWYYSNSVPSWWTRLWQQNPSYLPYEIYYKIASSEWSNYTRWYEWLSTKRWVIATYRWWFDTTDPIDVVSNTSYITSNTTNRAASMSVTNEQSPLIFFCYASNFSSALTFTKPSTPTTDWVENYDWWDTASDIYMEICSMTWSSSWATWNMDATISSSISNYKWAFAVALNPSVSTWNPWAFFQMF